ncbi:MAG: imelysin family protein [Planctomycetota bacterium]
MFTLFAALVLQAPAADEAPLAEQVAAHYLLQADARYGDALDGATALNRAVQALLREPTPEAHQAAKEAWITAHSIYSHTEVFRFGNPNVDAWEGIVNAWPMDEGLIDYVADGYVFHHGNPFATWDIVHNGDMPIDEELIAAFADGTDPKAGYELRMSDVESNVTTGYHAVEFLLWGQDLNQDPAVHGGQRPHTDFVTGEGCTGGRCDRRREYLAAAAGRLMYDLRHIIRDWNGSGRLYGATFQALPLAEQLERMVVGMGSLSYAELASERIRVALLTNDQEEEQSCFSDTTHLATLHNALGIQSMYFGQHRKLDGTVVSGPSCSDLVAALDPELDAALRAALAETEAAARAIVAAAEAGQPFDRMIIDEGDAGRELLRALIAKLQAQAELFEQVRTRVPELAAQ